METTQLVTTIVRSLDTHKAQDIQVLKVDEVTSIAEYFVIASTTSTTGVKALVDYVDAELARQDVLPLRTEGYRTSLWTLMDYGTVVVHVFLKSTREFYDLERLWQDATALDLAMFLEDEQP